MLPNSLYLQIIQDIRAQFTSDPQLFIPLHAPAFSGNEKIYLNECIDSTFVSSVGPFVDRIEKELAEYTGSPYAIACANGTAALHIALLLSGVQTDDLVITQPLSFIATANAIAYCNADPLFIDIDPKTLSLSAEKLKQFLENETYMRDGICYHAESRRPIRACVPMHTFGIMAEIDAIAQLCEKYHLALVEDAAESLGSFYKGKHSGTFAKWASLSFNGNKTITAGGGGAILTSDPQLAKMAKHLTTQAKVPHKWEFVHDHIGYNYRMPNINAALLCAQLEQLPSFLDQKRKLMEFYLHYFSTVPGIDFIQEPEHQKSNFWLCAILLPNKDERDRFLALANEHLTMCRPGWELLHKLPMFSHVTAYENVPVATDIQSRLVNIPSSPYFQR